MSLLTAFRLAPLVEEAAVTKLGLVTVMSLSSAFRLALLVEEAAETKSTKPLIVKQPISLPVPELASIVSLTVEAAGVEIWWSIWILNERVIAKTKLSYKLDSFSAFFE